MNVTILKTVPLFYTPDQNMYPGAAPVCYAHEFHFNGLEGKTQGQVWLWDSLGLRFRQRSLMGPITNGVMTLPITVAPSPGSGIMVLAFDVAVPTTISNKFTYAVSDVVITGGSVNLGEATGDIPFSGATISPVILPSPLPPQKKKGNSGK